MSDNPEFIHPEEPDAWQRGTMAPIVPTERVDLGDGLFYDPAPDPAGPTYMELIPTEPWAEEPYYLRAVEDGPGLPGTFFTPGDAHDPDLRRSGDDDFDIDL